MVGKLTPDNMVSASVVPVIMGLSPYKTQNEHLKRIIALDNGEPDPETFNGNEATHHGDALEPYILKTACERIGITESDLNLNEPFFCKGVMLAASLDGMGNLTGTIKTDPNNGIYVMTEDGSIDVDGWGCLEAKLTSAPPEERPAAYRGLWQIQAQMMCTGFSWGAIATLYQGVTLRIFVYKADTEMQNRIIDAISVFERRRADKEPYPVSSSADGNNAYPVASEAVPAIDFASIQGGQKLLLDLAQAKDDKKEAERRIDELEASIKEVLGEAAEGEAEIAGKRYIVKWPMRKVRAQPEKIVPAKPETISRQKTLTLKVIE
jgi:predicted phage-related endonuclease